MTYTISLEGRTALVTGASGGLGRHFAGVLAGAGARVVLAARRRDALEDACAQIRAAGGSAEAVSLDVTDPASVEAGFDAAAARFGPPDIILNNAGISGTRPALDMRPEEWASVIDTNLTGCFTVACAGARRLRDAQREGVIVNIASILGMRVAGMLAHYAAAKAGLVQLTSALALEWARHGIRVNALAPGYVETDLNRAFFATEPGQALIRRIPQRRLGQMSDLDLPLLALCAPGAGYVTGSVFAVDGGHLASSL
ncbi:SDR family oxidoreductase (plasmid) [Paroceanicella profunda]|uniref:SDR family oxidoreductase n=1 Tax=Paroceanicella profunda TaxID=2579971 RepID=A0A5B8FJR0_9RHOB|nr:SDR family NAD(P)-dependent oxidoreductase [Paroceanicella profunda]QDL94648.1 SDR family oxidoreductase [Paroceanicella profunda]